MPRVLIAAISAATLLIFLGPKFIAWLRANEVGQFVRPPGLIPDAHAEKQGTPTMGGLLILVATTLPFIILSSRSTEAMLVLFATLACGAIGFVDDFMKIVKKRSLGLSGRWRMLGLLAVSAVLVSVAVEVVGLPTTLDVPVLERDRSRSATVAFFVLVFLVVAGAANAVNLTDGLDGLAAGIARSCCSPTPASPSSPTSATWPSSAPPSSGACVGFLWFNSFPAAVFMGDTGSYALGGAIAAMAVMTKTEILLVVIGAIFVAEALSVIIQVIVFKRFRRRVFLMTPVHHHFEMAAWSETKIIVRFWLIAAIFARGGLHALLPRPPGGAPAMSRALVVGLARSGRAAAPSSPGAGWAVTAIDSGEAAAPELAAAGVEVRAPWSAPVEGVELVVKSPGVPGEAAPVAAARAAGAAVWSEIELAARRAAEPPRRDHRHQRQDHDHRAHGPPAAAPGGSTRWPAATRARPWRGWSMRWTPGRGWWWSARASSSRTWSASTRGRPRCSTWPPTTSTATAAWSATATPSCGCSPPRSRATWRSCRAPWRRGCRRGPATWTTGRRARTRPPGPRGACTWPAWGG